ncbi:bone morphogenetic protein receptor type-1B-like [Lytechinus variegatus]|uniref:bone morphogenetic protein receptor type-1B-like n=1 Tax=Lytechinus variegatus TaxID=7654 RepID=UPI001BB1DE30|nr:bone morphogenetic protein receptor type-1B-like [Lytechinus variegatus]
MADTMSYKYMRYFEVLATKMMYCYCDEHCPETTRNNTCYPSPGGWCFAQIQAGEDGVEHETPIRSYGCLAPEEDGGLMQCKGQLSNHRISRTVYCCNDEPNCNLKLNPTLPPTTTSTTTELPGAEDTYNTTVHQIALLISVTFCAAAFIIALTFFYLRYKKREVRRRYDFEVAQQDDSFIGPGETLSELLEKSSASGSGSGLPLLVQRTIAKQVQLIRKIGKGRFGEVWKAKWRGENVAVKIYFTAEEASWFRETEIYQTVLMRHTNILSFIAADIRGSGAYTQLFLITEYHECGSLYDFLGVNILDSQSMLRLAYSAANGLAHLHTEICGMQGKPAIAHRDMKSSNIMVRKNGTCMIADMSLAARFLSEGNEIDLGQNTRVGTTRYLPPEILDNAMMRNSFDAFKMADMYSFGMVLWEIARRCVTRGIVEECQLPFYDAVPMDPSVEDMRRVVVIERRRPDIPNRWSGDDILRTISKVMSECWNQNPAARVTSLRVKKTLGKLQENEFKV